jgi:hypothetical protein
MNDKILFSVLLPATGKYYDIWVPRELNVHEATVLMSRILAERESRFYTPSSTTALYFAADGLELRADICIGNLGLNDGARLILV